MQTAASPQGDMASGIRLRFCWRWWRGLTMGFKRFFTASQESVKHNQLPAEDIRKRGTYGSNH
jgi:hypothetical protein